MRSKRIKIQTSNLIDENREEVQQFGGKYLSEWSIYQQILYHLLHNSVRYSIFQGLITIKVDLVFQENNAFLKTVVVDNGLGISQRKLGKIQQRLQEQSQTIPLGIKEKVDDKNAVNLGFGLQTAKILA